MTTYRGPNVSVTQVFKTTPPATAIENLPSTVVATAFNVYKKKELGVSVGVNPTTVIRWPGYVAPGTGVVGSPSISPSSSLSPSSSVSASISPSRSLSPSGSISPSSSASPSA